MNEYRKYLEKIYPFATFDKNGMCIIPKGTVNEIQCVGDHQGQSPNNDDFPEFDAEKYQV